MKELKAGIDEGVRFMWEEGESGICKVSYSKRGVGVVTKGVDGYVFNPANGVSLTAEVVLEILNFLTAWNREDFDVYPEVGGEDVEVVESVVADEKEQG